MNSERREVPIGSEEEIKQTYRDLCEKIIRRIHCNPISNSDIDIIRYSIFIDYLRSKYDYNEYKDLFLINWINKLSNLRNRLDTIRNGKIESVYEFYFNVIGCELYNKEELIVIIDYVNKYLDVIEQKWDEEDARMKIITKENDEIKRLQEINNRCDVF